jgi:hypothetical protein
MLICRPQSAGVVQHGASTCALLPPPCGWSARTARNVCRHSRRQQQARTQRGGRTQGKRGVCVCVCVCVSSQLPLCSEPPRRRLVWLGGSRSHLQQQQPAETSHTARPDPPCRQSHAMIAEGVFPRMRQFFAACLSSCIEPPAQLQPPSGLHSPLQRCVLCLAGAHSFRTSLRRTHFTHSIASTPRWSRALGTVL